MKKLTVILFISLVLGSFIAFILFKNLNDNIEISFFGYEELSFFQAGVFSNKENADAFANSMKSATVVKDDGFYRVYISILNDEDSISIMKEHFNAEDIYYHIVRVNIKNEGLINEIKKYENVLLEATEESTYDAINKKILKLYENEV